jgi:hypothetical protein
MKGLTLGRGTLGFGPWPQSDGALTNDQPIESAGCMGWSRTRGSILAASRETF